MELKEKYEQYYENTRNGKEPKIWQIFALRVLDQLDFDGANVLDVGAGRGYILTTLKGKGIILHAIELSDECIENLCEQGIDARKVDISKEDFPFQDDCFDYVIFTEVIEHLVFPQHALSEIRRVLKADGKLLIETHNVFNLFMRLRYLMGKLPTSDFDVSGNGLHLRLLNYAVLMNLLRNAGFRRFVNRSWFELRIVKFYVPDFLTSLLARHLLLICSK